MPKTSPHLEKLKLAMLARNHAKLCQKYSTFVDEFFETVLSKLQVWNLKAQLWATGPFLKLRETLDDVFSVMLLIMKKSDVKAFRMEVETFMHTVAVPLRSFVHLVSNVHVAQVKDVLREVLQALDSIAETWAKDKLNRTRPDSKLLIQGWDRITTKLRGCLDLKRPETGWKTGWKFIKTGQFV